jgi:hypothetical protein
MSTINREDFDCEDCLEDALAKEQLLSYLTAYKVAVEEEDWEGAQDAALDCYEILQAFRNEEV